MQMTSPKDETAARQPYSSTSQEVSGTKTVPERERPNPEMPRARPRRRSNQLASSVLFGTAPRRAPATPRTRLKDRYKCQMLRAWAIARKPSSANAAPAIISARMERSATRLPTQGPARAPMASCKERAMDMGKRSAFSASAKGFSRALKE